MVAAAKAAAVVRVVLRGEEEQRVTCSTSSAACTTTGMTNGSSEKPPPSASAASDSMRASPPPVGSASTAVAAEASTAAVAAAPTPAVAVAAPAPAVTAALDAAADTVAPSSAVVTGGAGMLPSAVEMAAGALRQNSTWEKARWLGRGGEGRGSRREPEGGSAARGECAWLRSRGVGPGRSVLWCGRAWSGCGVGGAERVVWAACQQRQVDADQPEVLFVRDGLARGRRGDDFVHLGGHLPEHACERRHTRSGAAHSLAEQWGSGAAGQQCSGAAQGGQQSSRVY